MPSGEVIGALGDLTTRLIARLRQTGATVVAAESLTGGELTAELTRLPGASAVVIGGVVVYATGLKHSLLGVDSGLLAAEGPVHPDVARQLADGVRARVTVDGRPADLGIATTGVAGPDPQGGQTAGTVFIGVSSAAGTRVVTLALDGDRAAIRRATVERAIVELVIEAGA